MRVHVLSKPLQPFASFQLFSLLNKKGKFQHLIAIFDSKHFFCSINYLKKWFLKWLLMNKWDFKLPNRTRHQKPFFHLFIYGLLCWSFQPFFGLSSTQMKMFWCFQSKHTHQKSIGRRTVFNLKKSPFFVFY